MKKYRIVFLCFILMLSTLFVFNGRVDAKLASTFPDTITAQRGRLITYNGVNIYGKSYDNGTGKAFCTTFKRVAADGVKCKPVDWNSNAALNKRIAVGVGAIISKARQITSATDGSLDWETYFYGEMAINQFLYTYNGKKSDNNVASYIWGWSKVTANDKYKKLIAAGTNAYANYASYGKSDVSLSDASVSKDGNVITATAKVTCKNTVGTVTDCNLSTNEATVTVNYNDGTQGSATKMNVSTRKNSNKTLSVTYTYTVTREISSATVKIHVKDKVGYGVSQNYDCGKDYQQLVPNLVKTLYEYNEDSVEKSLNGDNCSFTVFKKSSDTNSALAGVTFSLYKGTSKISTKTTPNSGLITFSGLNKGTYTLKETKTPSGYNKISDRSIKIGTDCRITDENDNNILTNISVNDNGVQRDINVVQIENAPIKGSLKIKKVDDKGNAVSGAKVKIYTITDNPNYEATEATEETDQSIEISNTTDLGAEGEDYTLSDDGKYIFHYLWFDANGNYIPGATDSREGTLVDYFITTDTEKLIDDLTVGETYYIVEEALPEDSDYAAKIREDSVVIEEGNKTYEAQLVNVHSSFHISKQDITSKEELPGAILEIKDSRGITIYSWVSEKEPKLITGLPDGDYTLIETQAPKGYSVSESINFTIENGKVKNDGNTVIMYDKVDVHVPDTFSSQNILTMLLGLVMVGAGTLVLIYEFKKKKTA